jgi:hypothetical protein
MTSPDLELKAARNIEESGAISVHSVPASNSDESQTKTPIVKIREHTDAVTDEKVLFLEGFSPRKSAVSCAKWIGRFYL